MIRLWVQFNYQNIHNFDFWPNLAILKSKIYFKLQNTQSLGYKFGKKSRLRRWCKFLLENHEKSWFCHMWWQHLDAAYLGWIMFERLRGMGGREEYSADQITMIVNTVYCIINWSCHFFVQLCSGTKWRFSHFCRA